MSKKLVITIDGSKHPRSSCRKMGKEYYLIGDTKIENSGQCYLIDNRYYKSHTGYIVYDHRLNSYTRKNSSVIQGVIGLEKDNETCILGWFSIPENLTSEDFVSVAVDSPWCSYRCLNESIFKKNTNYIYNAHIDGYLPLRYTNPTQVIDSKYLPIDEDYKRSLNYSCSSNALEHAIKLFEDRYKTVDHILQTPVENVTKGLLKDLTFGFEFETISGRVPERLCRRLGLIPLRDGSISGLEYASIPYSGIKGIAALVEALDTLQKHTQYDDDCSLHIHIGGLPRTEKHILSLLKVLSVAQDPMYSMFPLYKKDNHGMKRKAYTAPIPFSNLFLPMNGNASDDFALVFRYLTMGHSYRDYQNDLNNVVAHPNDPGETSKWNVLTRYHWVNIIPIIFGNKQTVEFRLHTPTYDFNKIFTFLIICSSIIKHSILNVDNNNLHKISYKNELGTFIGMITETLARFVSYSSRGVYSHVEKYILDRIRYIDRSIQKGDVWSVESNFIPSSDPWKLIEKSALTNAEHTLKEILDELDSQGYNSTQGSGIHVGNVTWYADDSTTNQPVNTMNSMMETPIYESGIDSFEPVSIDDGDVDYTEGLNEAVNEATDVIDF